jgi:hypothetical protein
MMKKSSFNIFVYFNINLMSCLKKIKVVITKEDAVFKEAVTPKEKLAVCLRSKQVGASECKMADAIRR